MSLSLVFRPSSVLQVQAVQCPSSSGHPVFFVFSLSSVRRVHARTGDSGRQSEPACISFKSSHVIWKQTRKRIGYFTSVRQVHALEREAMKRYKGSKGKCLFATTSREDQKLDGSPAKLADSRSVNNFFLSSSSLGHNPFGSVLSPLPDAFPKVCGCAAKRRRAG